MATVLKTEKITISQKPFDWFQWNLKQWCILAFLTLWAKKLKF